MTRTVLDESQIEEIAGHWSIGRVTASERIEAGTINSNYRVDADRGGGSERYFLRINEGKTEADVRYEVELVDALAAAGVPTPAPVATSGGERFADVDGMLVSLFPWCSGHHRQALAVTIADAGKVGGVLAALHEAGRPIAARFRRRGVYTTPDMARRYRSFCHSSDAALVDAIAILGRELEALADCQAERASLPTAIIHGDLFRDNVLFDAGEVVALIDFEQASSGAPLYDLAVCLNAWCYRGGDFDLGLLEAMISGYRERGDLGYASAENMWIECRAAAMRFAITRITDVHLAGLERGGKSFARYVDRLSRWQELGPGALFAVM